VLIYPLFNVENEHCIYSPILLSSFKIDKFLSAQQLNSKEVAELNDLGRRQSEKGQICLTEGKFAYSSIPKEQMVGSFFLKGKGEE
jgi:hypothetical protein